MDGFQLQHRIYNRPKFSPIYCSSSIGEQFSSQGGAK
jgi:poly-D-alanine transfer protein DltD